MTPSTTAPALMDECVANNVKGAIIISAGFKEIGERLAPEFEVAPQARVLQFRARQTYHGHGVTQGSLQAAIFRSDDLDTTFEKVRASGAEVLQEPVSQPWGARDCAFRDPSGNLVRIAQA